MCIRDRFQIQVSSKFNSVQSLVQFKVQFSSQFSLVWTLKIILVRGSVQFKVEFNLNFSLVWNSVQFRSKISSVKSSVRFWCLIQFKVLFIRKEHEQNFASLFSKMSGFRSRFYSMKKWPMRVNSAHEHKISVTAQNPEIDLPQSIFPNSFFSESPFFRNPVF